MFIYVLYFGICKGFKIMVIGIITILGSNNRFPCHSCYHYHQYVSTTHRSHILDIINSLSPSISGKHDGYISYQNKKKLKKNSLEKSYNLGLVLHFGKRYKSEQTVTHHTMVGLLCEK
ncbi:hypothetical protein K501DRAFT_269944 [Backusella circina FSU 941]|nr:hypothetical protein K501DRAFT_269944 [Backusella circina FSU 941]